MVKLKRILYAFCFAFLTTLLSGNYSYSQTINIPVYDSPTAYAITLQPDTVLANRIMQELAPYATSVPTGELMVMTAKKLLGKPYVAGTLDEGTDEQLRVFLSKTDCIIFVETCMNIVLAVKEYGQSADFAKMANLVRQSRYRDGRVENYSDRIHYTTEWIRQEEARGILKDLSQELGGVVYHHPIFYMTKNYKKYSHLKEADAAPAGQAAKDCKVIADVERKLNEKPFYFIPKDKIKSIEKQIQNGDIVCYMSGVDGLDIAHVAIAYVENGRVGFIHASMAEMKVVIDKQTIDEYVNSRKGCPGIKICRIVLQ